MDKKEDQTDTISLLSPSDTLKNIDFKGFIGEEGKVKFDKFEDFLAFLLNIFATNNIKVYGSQDNIKIGEELGKGMFGVVFKATFGDQLLAIKFLDKIDHNEDPEKTIITIINELKTITAVNHDRIPKFHGVYQKEDSLGLMFSFIKGVTLNIYLEKNKLTSNEKLDLAIQLAEILVALHEKRVIHRDIKPKNTMVTPEGNVILIDFGISRINEKTVANTGGLKGSPAYSPPEAFIDTSQDDDRLFTVTTKFDVWSLGCVMMEMFSGEKPWSKKFKDSNRIMLALSKHTKFGLYDIPIPKGFDTDYPEIFEILKNCLIGNVKERYTSREMLAKLNELKGKLK